LIFLLNSLKKRLEIGFIFLSFNPLTIHNKNNKLFRKITKKAPFLQKNKQIFNLQFLSPKYPKELKWERQTVSCICKNCNDVNGGRPDSTRQTKVVIHPSYSLYVYHVKQ
jgi:hypothetical protein